MTMTPEDEMADVDAMAMRLMIEEADAEGGEIPFEEAMARLDAVIELACRH